MSYLILPPLDPDPDKKLEDWIRIHTDIFGILDPHENLCGFETLLWTNNFCNVDTIAPQCAIAFLLSL